MLERIENSSKYAPTSWTKQAMDQVRKPQESDRELLTRLLEEAGSVTALGRIINATRRPVIKLLISEFVIEPGQRLYYRLNPATKAKMSASTTARWAKEKRKSKEGLPSLLDSTQSETARKRRQASLEAFWESEEGSKRRQEMSANQRKARLAEPAITGIKHRPRDINNVITVEQASRLGLLSSIDPKTREILQNRYLSENPASLSDLGKLWGMTRQAVHQREKTTLQHLARKLEVHII